MLNSSILPKLLAKENITIRHGNYHTAWFDVKNRVLGLPNWKDMGKDVYDLLCGHEVGHALFTPESGWHDSPEKLKGAPRSYLNVIEDARIERDIRNTYPGLIAAMQRGYVELLKQGFFGEIDGIDWDQTKLIDKINLKTKLGSMIDVPFNSEEEVFLNRAFANQNFDEVVQLAKDILVYTKENQEELLQPQEQPELTEEDLEKIIEGLEDEGPQQGHDDQEEEQGPGGSANSEGDSEEEGEEKESKASESGDEESDEETSSSTLSETPQHVDEDISITDESFRSMEDTLIDKGNGRGFMVMNELRPYHVKNAVIDYKQLAQERKARTFSPKPTESEKGDFKKYIKDVKRSVNFAVKEFEQRKAAYRYTRATTAKTGRLDVGKLWSYKTSEDIFSQVTTLADAKNHGMIMLVDYSGSMAGSMPYVMDQLLHMVHFCKAVNIPFDVYGFTTQNKNFHYDCQEFMDQIQDGDMDMNDLSMPLVCSSSLGKKDFNDAIYHMYDRQASTYWNDGKIGLGMSEEYGSTPLDQALVVSHHLVKDFKQKHSIEKLTFACFSDGDSNFMGITQKQELADKKLDSCSYSSRGTEKIAIIQGKKVKLNAYRATDNLLENISKMPGVKTMGFFMADDSGHWQSRIGRLSQSMPTDENDPWGDNFKKECAAEYRKNKCVHKNNAFGYDDYYLLKGGKNLKATDGEFDDVIESDASDAQIRNAFKKYSKGKKTNKVLMTSIGKAVA